MREQLLIEYDKIDKQNILDEDVRRLLAAARGRLADSYSPYSKFRVAAALLLDSGEIISGANQENAAFPSCLCAEQVAFAAAASQAPGQKILKTLISTSSLEHEPAAPCGNCRQVIAEFENRQDSSIVILLEGKDFIYQFDSIKSLLPLGFAGGHFMHP